VGPAILEEDWGLKSRLLKRISQPLPIAAIGGSLLTLFYSIIIDAKRHKKLQKFCEILKNL